MCHLGIALESMAVFTLSIRSDIISTAKYQNWQRSFIGTASRLGTVVEGAVPRGRLVTQAGSY